jgi:Flp pilus assembly protein TadG
LQTLLHVFWSTARLSIRPQQGQALVQMTLLLTTFFGLVGAGIDWGRLIIEKTRIQAAADAAALAGARALASSNYNTTTATASANNYLSLHGYVHNTNATTVSLNFSSSMGNSSMDTITVQVDRTLSAYFWRLMGIQSLPTRGRAVASPGAATVDVMMSLDLTGSMEASGTNDLQQLRQAVVDFANQMNPDVNNSLGPKIGIARWAGIYCSWARVGDNDSKVDVWSPSEYGSPCYDDKTVLTNLTFTKSTLIKIADNSGGGTCPGAAGAPLNLGCPLDHRERYPYQTNGTAVNPTDYQCKLFGFEYDCGNLPAATGTKMPNGVSVVCNLGGLAQAWSTASPNGCYSSGYYAWSTANGGRNGTGSDPYARKALVLMTDGVNETVSVPNFSSPPDGQTAGQWATDVVTMANTLKRGPDNTTGTTDDVDIYVVGFFCTPYSATGTGTPERWCKSAMADITPHPCPSPTWNAGQASTTDTLLRSISSSTAGGCEKYYPIKKTESLPQLFQNIAGSIARGRLST